MGAAYFYHLTRAPLEVTLPQLLDKAMGQGWRIVVRGREQGRMEWLDEKLWLGPDDGFLPHGLSGGPHDGLQPVLLTTDNGLDADVACVMSIDGAELTPDEVNGVERACILFDGHDEAAVSHARNQWKSLTDAGCAAQYWSEASGRWTKEAEKG